ncbi:hypothetical protein GEMRC1_013161 [Eukaryota sp. GEM-RC1]
MLLARACVYNSFHDEFAKLYDTHSGFAQLRDSLNQCLNVLVSIRRESRPQVSLVVANAIRQISSTLPDFTCSDISQKFHAERSVMNSLAGISLGPLPKSFKPNINKPTLSSRVKVNSLYKFGGGDVAMESLVDKLACYVASSPIVIEEIDNSSPFLNFVDFSKTTSFMSVAQHLPPFLKFLKLVREHAASMLKYQAVIAPITSILCDEEKQNLFDHARDSYQVMMTCLLDQLGKDSITVGCQADVVPNSFTDSSYIGLFTLDESGETLTLRTFIEDEFINTHNTLVGNYSLGSIDPFSINSDSFVQIKCDSRGVTFDPFTCRFRVVDHVYDGYILSGLIKHKIEPITPPEFLLSKTKDLYDLEDSLLRKGFTVEHDAICRVAIHNDDFQSLYNEILIAIRIVAAETPNNMSLRQFLEQKHLTNSVKLLSIILVMLLLINY